MKNSSKIILMLAILAFVSCRSKQSVVSDGDTQPAPQQQAEPSNAAQQQRLKQSFVKKVADNAVYVDNITAKIDFTFQSGSKDITVGGKLQMRRDDVIRIQLQAPIVGMEVGRMEFTKDYVMIVDRLHTEYIKGDYTQIDFLKNNGLNFYALQALFWNQLFVPGQTKVREADLSLFDADISSPSATTPVVLSRNNMTYQWQAESKSGLIRQVDVAYSSKQHGNTKLNCTYDDFKPLGVKQFPASIALDMKTAATQKARQVKMIIRMKNIDTDSKWDARTQLSKKYKQVSVDDVLKKLMSL